MPKITGMHARCGTSRTALGWTFACTSRTTRADLASQTAPLRAMWHHTPLTPGFLPSWAPLPSLLNRSGCRATTTRIQPHGLPPLSASSSVCTRTSYSTTTAPISRRQHNKRRRPAQAAALLPRGRKPAASACALPGQRQRQTRPPATQPPPRGIQAESGFPPSVFQLSGPAAHSAQAHSFATLSHAAAHQGMAPVQGPTPALRGHAF
jgi:hypothetical protein